MRHPTLVSAAVVLAALLPASPLRAQHCWPTAVAMVLRDAAGRAADAGTATEVRTAPRPSRAADFSFGIQRLDREWGTPSAGADTVPALVWMGRGTCSIDIDTVTVRRGAREMRLLLDVHVNTQRRPGHSVYVIDTPPFRPGTYRLGVCTFPLSPDDAPAIIPATAWHRERPGRPKDPCRGIATS